MTEQTVKFIILIIGFSCVAIGFAAICWWFVLHEYAAWKERKKK